MVLEFFRVGFCLVIGASALSAAQAGADPVSQEAVKKVLFPIEKADLQKIRQMGQEVLEPLARIYASSDDRTKATIAWIFYSLGWKSRAVKELLMKDVHTQDQKLRLQVQWALGRVSDDKDVVQVLLDNMQNDSNPLFRDKAACALASDQIHLSDKQKVDLYAGLIKALGDPKDDVRRIAITALRIQTGQDKGYNFSAPEAQRNEKIKEWLQWLEKYKSNL